MNGRLEQNLHLIDTLVKQSTSVACAGLDIIVCPPLVQLAQIQQAAQASNIKVGAQNVAAYFDDGAHTGEVSAPMLLDVGINFTLIGHSERRQDQAEHAEMISQKLNSAMQAGLYVILCVGETLVERESGSTLAIISSQIQSALSSQQHLQCDHLIVAYEPVWAIGTGKTASPEQAQEIHAHIRNELSALLGSDQAQSISLLYGGSVKADNAAELFSQPDINGALVGGASLKADEFIAICQHAATSLNND